MRYFMNHGVPIAAAPLDNGPQSAPPETKVWIRHCVRLIFRTLLATTYENFCWGPPLEKILGVALVR